jgi:Ca2+-binding EF-hand superfamily protein
MGFYMLPEDRVREDAIIAGEHAKRTHIKGLKRNKGGHITVLVNRLRVAIESRAPKGITARATLRREFALIDRDKSGAVDLKEFLSVIGRYLNGAEPEDLKKLFHSFDKDGNGTVSVEEFTDMLLKEAGPHNFRHKEYKRNKPIQTENEDKPPPSSRPRSGKSQWTSAVKRQAGKTLTTIPSNRSSTSTAKDDRNRGATPSMGDKPRRSSRRPAGISNQSRRPSSTSSYASSRGGARTYNEASTSSSSSLGSRAHSLRFAHRHVDQYKENGTQPLTRDAIEQHMSTLMIEEMTVQYLSQFRRAVRRSSGKELTSSKNTKKTSEATLTEKVLNGDAKAANTLVWTMKEFAKKSSSSDKTRLSQKRFQAALNIFRGNSPPVDDAVSRLLWAASGQGKINLFVERCFPTVKVD